MESAPKDKTRERTILKTVVIASFLLTLVWLLANWAITSQIDGSLSLFGGGLAVVLVLAAVLVGYIEPDKGISDLSTRLAMSWVTAASKTRRRTFCHAAALAMVSVLVYLGAWRSIYSGLGCQLGMRYSWHNWLGREIEASCTFGELSPIWSPFSRPEKIHLRAAKDGTLTAKECRISGHWLACDWLPRKNPKDGAKYVWIKPGDFIMGCLDGYEGGCHNNLQVYGGVEPDVSKICPGQLLNSCRDNPPHKVRISTGFWMAETEVTVGSYYLFRKDNPAKELQKTDEYFREINDMRPQMPAVFVTWEQARDYCSWAGGAVPLRLPTEAEWEYAARAGSTTDLPAPDPAKRYGNVEEYLTNIAWFADNPRHRLSFTASEYVERLKEDAITAHPVGLKDANAWGLHDMLGNTWEWTNDWYGPYPSSLQIDPEGSKLTEATVFRRGRATTFRVLRGGSWDWPVNSLSVSSRYFSDPEQTFGSFGFRCAGQLPWQ